MCGRFTLYVTPEELASYFGLAEAPVLAPRYNIAPTQPVGVVRLDPRGQAREWALTIWGLIPSWSQDPSIGARLINARAETVDEKPSFRTAFKRRRCIVPASGFYEWKKSGSGKQPHYITSADGAPLGFAGLWERWTGPDGTELESCTILTTDPNEKMSELHNRMPVILAPEDFSEWLGTGGDDTPATLAILKHLFRPYPAERLEIYPVSLYVNNPRNEGAQCVEHVPAH
ncbi:MAG: SOS response-associated peptidase [Caldilineaceae bacterium]|nr:SOS response-associated peptidase [Caldilineaceae bacterium]